jgi:cytoskeletal protein RodZ
MDETFASFFRDRIKDRGMSLKKLSETTGIALSHLENMVRGNFEDVPSAPYFHGYIVRLGHELDFDGEEWWTHIKKEGLVKNSGPLDSMPHNRFVQQSRAKFVGIAVIILIVLVYLVIQLPRIWGKPTLALMSPNENPFTTQSSTIAMSGTIQNANSLTLNGDQITIMPDGSWQKNVLLQDGINTFQFTAKKFLGGETDIIEQVIYDPSATMIPSSTVPTSTIGQ